MSKWAMRAHFKHVRSKSFSMIYLPLTFDPRNRSLKFRESINTPSPKVGVALGVWVYTPSHSLTPSYIQEYDVTLGLPFGPHPYGLFASTLELPLGPHLCSVFALIPDLPFGPQPCNPFALVTSPKLGLRQILCNIIYWRIHEYIYNIHWYNKATVSFWLP
jgi:hypothetical protein